MDSMLLHKVSCGLFTYLISSMVVILNSNNDVRTMELRINISNRIKSASGCQPQIIYTLENISASNEGRYQCVYEFNNGSWHRVEAGILHTISKKLVIEPHTHK